MGMHLHLDMSPTSDPMAAHVYLTLNYLYPEGGVATIEIFDGQIELKEYNETRPIEAWVIAALSSVATDVTRKMTGQLVRGPKILIPAREEAKFF